jgi:hypothetical protein
VFHFNKKHLEDPAVPMWILKTQGKTYYVEHVSCSSPWSTKETPDNSHTKGSIKVKDCLLIIDESNQATIRPITTEDKFRLHNRDRGITRVIVHERDAHGFRKYLKDLEIKHGPLKGIGGACSSTFYITDILVPSHFTVLGLSMSGTSFRELMPNEGYYKIYDQGKDVPAEHLWEEDYEEEYEEDDDDQIHEEAAETDLRHSHREPSAFASGKRLFGRVADQARTIRSWFGARSGTKGTISF